MKNRTFLVSVATAFLIGYFTPDLINHQEAPPVETTRVTKPTMPETSIATSVVKETPETTEALPSNSTSHPDKLLRRFLLGKFKEAGGYLRLNVFDGEGNITEAFAELYGLVDWEIEALAAESAKARERHFQLAKANSQITRMEDGGTQVVLNPFESDENIYAEVLDSFQRVLGDDRFADFLDLGEAEMRDKFNQFGAERLSVEVVPETEFVEGPDGQLVEVTKYTIVESKEGANQRSSRSLNNIGEDYFSSEFDLIKRLIDDTEP